MQTNLITCAFLGGGFTWLCEAAALPTRTAMHLAVAFAGYEPQPTHPPAHSLPNIWLRQRKEF